MTAQKILFLLRTPPYAGARAYETLEALLVAAVFDQEISVLFSDDGVYQLLKDQNAAPLGTRTVGDGLKALATYDVDRLFVSETALRARGLATGDFELPVAVLDGTGVASLIRAQDTVISG